MSANTDSYHNFAYYYNQLIDESFYDDYVLRLSELKKFNNILDLGCGSGSLAFKLKNDYNQVLGIDLSNEMLMIAMERNVQEKKGIQFVQQDFKELILPKNNFDLVVSTLDSLNYLETIYLKDIFTKVFDSLVVGGYFCFDLLTQFYLDEVVNDYYQCEEMGEFEYVWQVKKKDEQLMYHQLEIISDLHHFKEEHYQYLHDFNFVKKTLEEVGFKIVDIDNQFYEIDMRQPVRNYFICLKENTI